MMVPKSLLTYADICTRALRIDGHIDMLEKHSLQGLPGTGQTL